MSEVNTSVEFANIEAKFKEQHELLESFIEKANGEIETAGKESAETRQALDSIGEKLTALGDRMQEIEQKGSAFFNDTEATKSLGVQFTETKQFEAMRDGTAVSARMQIKGGLALQMKTAIVNATGQNQPLVPSDRLAGIIHEPNRALRMRDVVPTGRTSSNLIEYAKENVFTNNAGPQVGQSPEVFENVTKPESAITFTLATSAVTTLAHFIPASKQILDDAPGLASYIDARLMYGLKLKEDDEILNGTGTNGNLTGLWTGKTAYAQTASPHPYSTKLDIVRDAIRQCHGSNYQPDVIVLNPQDWAAIELAKDSQGRYLFANPQTAAQPRLWGLPVVLSNTMTAGRFLVIASPSCMIFDREDANVQVSMEDSTNFQKNMCTIRAEERLAFVIFRAAGIVGGTFPS